MLTNISEQAADALLRQELQCGEVDFRTLDAQSRDIQENVSLPRANDLPVRDRARLAAA